MRDLQFYKGERRKITVEITSSESGRFTIKNPTYTLTGKSKVAAEGVPSVDGQELVVVLTFQSVGSYVLEFCFEVGEDIVKKRINVKVVE